MREPVAALIVSLISTAAVLSASRHLLVLASSSGRSLTSKQYWRVVRGPESPPLGFISLVNSGVPNPPPKKSIPGLFV